MINLMTWLDNHPRATRCLIAAAFLLACALQEIPGVASTW